SRRSPRSLPYDVEFSLTRNSSRTPCSASQRASASRSSGGRDRNAPRNLGIAQNVQRRSQPEASLRGAYGPVPSLLRYTRGPDAGATACGRSGAWATSTDPRPPDRRPSDPGWTSDVAAAAAPPWRASAPALACPGTAAPSREAAPPCPGTVAPDPGRSTG